jgi:hypothetical protein
LAERQRNSPFYIGVWQSRSRLVRAQMRVRRFSALQGGTTVAISSKRIRFTAGTVTRDPSALIFILAFWLYIYSRASSILARPFDSRVVYQIARPIKSKNNQTNRATTESGLSFIAMKS